MSKLTKPLSIRLHELLKSEFDNSSANLRKFAMGKKYSQLKNHYRVYKDSNGELHLGHIDDVGLFCGRRLLRLACGDFQTFAYGIEEPKDVTEWFMGEYKSKGMCAYTDMRHTWDIGNAAVGAVRECIYCGYQEVKCSKMVEKTWWEATS